MAYLAAGGGGLTCLCERHRTASDFRFAGCVPCFDHYDSYFPLEVRSATANTVNDQVAVATDKHGHLRHITHQ